jgi:hypothetical protein
MTPKLPAGSHKSCDTRPPAAVPKRPSGRSRSPRIDRSTITSPATRPWTQISPGARGTTTPTATAELHNHSPPTLTTAPVQISSSQRLRSCSSSQTSVTERSGGLSRSGDCESRGSSGGTRRSWSARPRLAYANRRDGRGSPRASARGPEPARGCVSLAWRYGRFARSEKTLAAGAASPCVVAKNAVRSPSALIGSRPM